MKTKLTLLLTFMCAFFASRAQQVPNGNFDTWTDAYAPTSWTSYEEIIPQLQGTGLIHKDSLLTYNGSHYSVELTNKYISLAGDTLGAVVALGVGSFNGQAPSVTGVHFTFRPDTLQFVYQYAPNGIDTAGFQIAFNSTGNDTGYNLNLYSQLTATNGQWEIISVPLTSYYMDSTAVSDTLNLNFTSSLHLQDTITPQGSVFHLDGVRFGYIHAPTLIEAINNDISASLFPNPAKNMVHFKISEAQNNSSVMVFDIAGRVVTHEFVSGNNFDLNTTNWSSGLYTYVLLSNNVVVNKGKFVIEK